MQEKNNFEQSKKTYFSIFISVAVGLIISGLFCTSVYVFAVYGPGETLNPTCTPGTEGCTVKPPLTDGFISNFEGTGDIKTTGSFHVKNNNTYQYFGANDEAKIYFNGSNLVIVPGPSDTRVLNIGDGGDTFYSLKFDTSSNPGTIQYTNSTKTFDFTNLTADATVSVRGLSLKNPDGDIVYTLPTTDGSENQFLKTDGSGTLSWGTVDTSGLVPYTGATNNVDLGSNNLTTTGTGTFGNVYSTKSSQNVWLDAYDSGGLRTINADGILYYKISGTSVGFTSSSIAYSAYNDKPIRLGQSGSNYGQLQYKSSTDEFEISTAGTTKFNLNVGAVGVGVSSPTIGKIQTSQDSSVTAFTTIPTNTSAIGYIKSTTGWQGQGFLFSSGANNALSLVYNGTSAYFGKITSSTQTPWMVLNGNGLVIGNTDPVSGEKLLVSAGTNTAKLGTSSYAGDFSGPVIVRSTLSATSFSGSGSGLTGYAQYLKAGSADTADYATAAGYASTADYASSAGYASTADYASSAGYASTAGGISAENISWGSGIAIGYGAYANSNYSVAIGYGAYAGEANQILIADGNGTQLTIYGGSADFQSNSVTAVAFTESSSIRFKRNIRPLEKNFYNILQLEPKVYELIKTGSTEIGYIAEDLEALGFKELVSYDKDGLPMGINYSKISLYLAEIIKKQQVDINAIKQKIGINVDELTINQLGSIENGQIASITPSSLSKMLSQIGISLSDGVGKIKAILTDRLFVKIARINKMEMVDDATGEIYCTWIQNGEWQKVKGECSSPNASIEENIKPATYQEVEATSSQVEKLLMKTIESQKVAEKAEQSVQNIMKTTQNTLKEAKSVVDVSKNIIESQTNKIKEEATPKVIEEATPKVVEEAIPKVVEEATQQILIPKKEEVPTPESEGSNQPTQELSIGKLIKSTTAGLMNGVIDFIKWIFGEPIKKLSSTPQMKSLTQGVSQDVEFLGASLLKPITNLFKH